jgi:phosphotriesterase-related protein
MTITTHPSDSGDVKQLRAAARASRITGAAITLHQWIRDGEALPKTLDILEVEGADLSRVIVGHIAGDGIDNIPLLEAVLARGVTLEFDLFGVPFYLGAPHLDNRRMADAVIVLAAKGYAGQLLLSHDVCTKLQQKRYGGKGYDYVLKEVAPHLRRQGVTDAQLRQILVENPARLLAIAPPEGPR